MKKLLFVCLLLCLCFSSTAAQEDNTLWTPFFSDDFSANLNGWPEGESVEGSIAARRVFENGDYVWNLTSSEPNFTFIARTPDYPYEDSRFRFSTEIRLPDFTPYACAGILLDGENSAGSPSFYAFMVCNDKTYGLLRYENSTLTNAIPFTPIKDYDSFKMNEISIQINNGWADLYYEDTTLDTYNTGFNYGAAGLIAMPQSTEALDVRFGSFTMESSNDPVTDSFNASAIADDVPEDMARLIKMLNLKNRIESSGGTYQEFPDKEISLAMMGYTQREELNLRGQDLILESEIAWSSAYERPDYAASACGLFIRDEGSQNYLEIYAAMDGVIYVDAYRWGQRINIMNYSYDSWSIAGSGKLGVVADSLNLTILWNDVILGTITNATWIGDGTAGYTIHSGTNADYGTKCVFSSTNAYTFTD